MASESKVILSVLVGILILGALGLSQNVFADPLTLFHTSFVDSFSVLAQETFPRDVAFSSDGTKMFVVGISGDDINEYTLVTPFSVSTAAFVDSFSVAAQDGNPRSVTFSSDGTKMFVLGSNGDDINEYTLSTAFDVSTASFADSFLVAAQEGTPEGVAFSSDGTKMFVLGSDGDDVNEYTLVTPFDVSTASFVDSFSVAAQETTPTGLAFSSDGTKMFVAGDAGIDVNQYTLSTAFDVSTASFVDSFSVAAQDTASRGLVFSSDGTKMFVVGAAGDKINEYVLASQYTLFHTTFEGSFSVAAQEAGPSGVAFSSDGAKMFVVGHDGDGVNEYTLSSAFDVSTASFVDSFSVAAQETFPEGLVFSSDGTKMFVLGFVGEDVNEYTLSSAFDVSTASFVDSFSVAAQDNDPRDLAFSSDGTKMFVVGSGGDEVNEYTLSTAFDVSTASFVDSFSVVGQDTTPKGLAFSSGGTKMFVLGREGDDINQYTLSTAFDVSTASFVDSFSIVGQEAFSEGLAFSSDGIKMFFVGGLEDEIHEYTLASEYTLFHTTFVDSFSVVGQEGVPTGVAFSSDGAKMFVVGNEGVKVNQYTLSTAFDVSTASFVDSFSVVGQETDPRDVAFSSDGAKMFVVGNTGDDINQYALTAPFDVSTATFVDSFSVAAQEIFPTGVAFSSDGTKMFVVGLGEIGINEYTLTAPFDVSTGIFVDDFSVAAQETIPTGVTFSSNGAKMFVVGQSGANVYEYTLVTPFDVSTGIFVDDFSVTAQETAPTGVAFSSDGTKMFVVGFGGDDINEYSITSILPPCSPPSSGDWIITESCEISSDIIAPASVMIQNNSDVIVNSEGSLIVLSGENIIIVNGSSLKLIQGSNLQVNS